MRISRRPLWVAFAVAGFAVPAAVATGAQALETNDASSRLTTAFQVDSGTGAAAPTVRFTARNTSSKPVSVLSWDLPQDQQTDQVLTVTRNGTAVAYRGRMVKHAPPTAADYVRIDPGRSYTAEVKLTEDYDLSQPGDYTVRLASTKARLGGQGGTAVRTTKATLKSSNATFHTDQGYTASLAIARLTGPDAVPSLPPSVEDGVSVAYNGCSSSQKQQVRQAVTDAKAYIANARSWLAEHTSGGGDYATWFGEFSSSRYSHVKSTFSSLSVEFTSKTVTVDCSCTKSYYAYVYPDDPYKIYVCDAYWTAPRKGYDSKAGTLIHESTHFTVNGGSDDHVYGLEPGRELAQSSPSKAVTNADNLEHFAEGL